MFAVNSFFQKKLKNLSSSIKCLVYVDFGGIFSTRDRQLSIIIYRSRRDNRFMALQLPDARFDGGRARAELAGHSDSEPGIQT
mgnify:CR=1 FL=1